MALPLQANITTVANDLIHDFVGYGDFNFSGLDEKLTEFNIPDRQRMAIITRLSKLHERRLTEMHNIIRAIMSANWEQKIPNMSGEQEPDQPGLFEGNQGFEQGLHPDDLPPPESDGEETP